MRNIYDYARSLVELAYNGLHFTPSWVDHPQKWQILGIIFSRENYEFQTFSRAYKW